MMLRDEQDADWTLLGTFGGAELAFVCELFADENVPFHEEPRRPELDIARSDLWIAASEHARAVALLAQAQAEAAEAVQRETAALAADEAAAAQAAARAAEAAARAAEAAAQLEARQSRHAARMAARRERKEARRHHHEPAHPSTPHLAEHDPAAERAVRFVGAALLGFLLVIAVIFAIGERYGTHQPTPGRDRKAVYCGPRQVICP
jgi:hypothetical protein